MQASKALVKVPHLHEAVLVNVRLADLDKDPQLGQEVETPAEYSHPTGNSDCSELHGLWRAASTNTRWR